MLKVGDAFPEFSLNDQDGNLVTKQSLLGQRSVIYFYPKDDTPGCTTEACEFNEARPQFGNAKVYGVSPDNEKSHKKFADKFTLAFTLLADTDHTLAEACGVWVEKSMYGKKYMGVERTTFIVDEEGNVATMYEKVKPKGHAAEVLTALK
jgi:peroxiredoxin Q/BCP